MAQSPSVDHGSEAPADRALVFVIGDSISMGYGPFLEQYLAPRFRYAAKRGSENPMPALGLPVHGNGGDSSQVLKYLQSNDAHGEIPATDYLLINCGLHDIRTDPATGVKQIDENSYRTNLKQIVATARPLCRHVCWVRSTPCDEAVHNTRPAGFHRYAADGRAYNAIADSVMRSNDVPEIDLYAFSVAQGPDLYADHVHFHPHIQARQAAFIAGWIHAHHDGVHHARVGQNRS
jgi:lysophospholipase L1-like esterase